MVLVVKYSNLIHGWAARALTTRPFYQNEICPHMFVSVYTRFILYKAYSDFGVCVNHINMYYEFVARRLQRALLRRIVIILLFL